jgi:co-chaperonin GroES (HSP10)
MKLRLLPGRVAIREDLPEKVGAIVLPGGYHQAHERDRRSHRGIVLAVGPPARTRKGVEVPLGFGPGDVVHFVFDSAPAYGDASRLGVGGATEKARRGVWPKDGLPCTWVAQEEIVAVEESIA